MAKSESYDDWHINLCTNASRLKPCREKSMKPLKFCKHRWLSYLASLRGFCEKQTRKLPIIFSTPRRQIVERFSVNFLFIFSVYILFQTVDFRWRLSFRIVRYCLSKQGFTPSLWTSPYIIAFRIAWRKKSLMIRVVRTLVLSNWRASTFIVYGGIFLDIYSKFDLEI